MRVISVGLSTISSVIGRVDRVWSQDIHGETAIGGSFADCPAMMTDEAGWPCRSNAAACLQSVILNYGDLHLEAGAQSSQLSLTSYAADAGLSVTRVRHLPLPEYLSLDLTLIITLSRWQCSRNI